MSRKVDLAAMRILADSSTTRIARIAGPVLVAMIDRIRDLESELRGCADALAGIGPVPSSDDVLDIANKGVVVE